MSLTHLKNYIGLDVLKPLVDPTTNPDPLKRLTVEESTNQFSTPHKKCSTGAMKQYIWRNRDPIPPLTSLQRSLVKYFQHNPLN
jgi:hypothetical protein